MDKNIIPDEIEKIAITLINEIQKYYPNLINSQYDNCGFSTKNGVNALSRAKMCIYIELLKAGAFND